jgi:hypothetical protein
MSARRAPSAAPDARRPRQASLAVIGEGCRFVGYHRLPPLRVPVKFIEEFAQRRAEGRPGANLYGHFGQGIGAFHGQAFLDSAVDDSARLVRNLPKLGQGIAKPFRGKDWNFVVAHCAITIALPSPRLLVNLPPDQHAADFAGAGADFVELGVAQQPAGREIVDATSTSRVYTQHLESGQEQFQRAVVRFAADPARMLRAAWQRVTASTEFYASADCKRACTLTCSPWRAARRAFDDGTKWTFGEHYNTSGLGSV